MAIAHWWLTKYNNNIKSLLEIIVNEDFKGKKIIILYKLNNVDMIKYFKFKDKC